MCTIYTSSRRVDSRERRSDFTRSNNDTPHKSPARTRGRAWFPGARDGCCTLPPSDTAHAQGCHTETRRDAPRAMPVVLSVLAAAVHNVTQPNYARSSLCFQEHALSHHTNTCSVTAPPLQTVSAAEELVADSPSIPARLIVGSQSPCK
jgi:hypothetical protein